MLGRHRHQIGQHSFSDLLWQFMALGQPGCHLLQRDVTCAQLSLPLSSWQERWTSLLARRGAAGFFDEAAFDAGATIFAGGAAVFLTAAAAFFAGGT
jgi:hypothetical protein